MVALAPRSLQSEGRSVACSLCPPFWLSEPHWEQLHWCPISKLSDQTRSSLHNASTYIEGRGEKCCLPPQPPCLPNTNGKLVSPEGAQEGKNTCPLAVIRPQPLITASPEEAQVVRTGYWPQTAEVHINRMISVSPDSCIFPYIEKHLIP